MDAETQHKIPVQVVFNPLWRSLPYLPPGGREAALIDECERRRSPLHRGWLWADEAIAGFRAQDLSAYDDDAERFYYELINKQVLLVQKWVDA